MGMEQVRPGGDLAQPGTHISHCRGVAGGKRWARRWARSTGASSVPQFPFLEVCPASPTSSALGYVRL